MNGAGDGLKIRLAEATPQGGSASTDGKAVETISAAEPSDNVIDATGRLKAPSAVPELRKSVEALPAEQMAQPEQVAAGDGSGGAEPAAAAERVKPEASDGPPKPPPRKSAAPVKRTGQVAVFISRKEKKIFVRQGFVPIFDMPVVIDEPDQPLGTHVFTAMAVVDGGVRWNVMTVPNEVAPQAERRDSRKKPKEPPKPTVQLKPSSTAAGALERVQIPKEALDRIGELLIPGSSLVVSDEGLGRETGRATEFIVLTR
jgi:hypothetical protein